MATRVLGPTGSRRRRRFLFVSLLLVACTALFLAGSAQAVHEFTLQLDGDVSTHAYTVQDAANQVDDWGANACNVADTTPPPPCATGIAGQTDTGHSIFLASRNVAGTTESVDPNPATVGTGKAFDSANFQRDFESGASCALNSTSATRCNADDTTYSTGSKDTLGIANGGWQCGHSQNVNNKVDINNAYITSFWVGGSSGNGHHILYAGVEKEKNNGTNDIGVWFLQASASCKSTTGANINWSGSGHRNGDVLLVSEFSNGGGVSTVKTFTWRASTDQSSPFFGDGGCIDSRPGHFNPAVDGGCNKLQSGGGGDCKSASVTDTTCATTNAQFKVDPTTGKSVPADPYAGTVSTPWLSSDATLGVGNNQVVAPDFIEMGIDITALFAGTGEAAPSCFSTGIPDTRSAPSVTATLFDYTVNTIGGCGSSTVTHPQDSSGTNIGTDGLSIGANAAVPVRDHADITVTGFTGSFAGTVTFFLCGPLALTPTTTNCNDTDPATGGDTHGVQIGDPVDVSGSGGSASVNSFDSGGDVNGNTILTSVGRYCWRAVYSGDGDVPGSLDPAKTSSSTSECFKVQPLKATLSTAASCTKTNGTDCVINVDTLSDTATVGNTAKKPGTNGIGAATAFSAAGTIDATNQAGADNSITWTLKFGASCTAVTRFGSVTRTVNGNGVYPTALQSAVSYSPSTSATPPDSPGLYTFVAAYPGDSPNTTAADSTACPDTGHTEEITVIGTASSSSKQGWLPNDRITLGSTAGTTLKGTLTVTLYWGAKTASSTLANCAVTATSVNEFSQSFSIDRTGLSPSNSDTEFTTNSTHYVGTNPSTGVAGDLPDTDVDHSYFWLIHYDDNSLTDPSDRCETSTVTHNDG